MTDDERQIRDLIREWLEASKRGDTAAVLELMADDVVFLVAGRPPMRGRSAFADAQAGMNGFELDARSEVEEVRVFGDWAYAWTTLTVVVHPPGGAKAVTRSGNTLSILRKEDSGWIIFRDANMLTVVPDNG
jgi:uncharacterized protein (TIGR02246 family)